MPNDDTQTNAPRAAGAARLPSFSAAAVCVIVLAGIGLRWCYLDAPAFHPDETHPLTFIERYQALGSLDVNLARTPGAPKGDQYTGSAYHLAVIGWDAVVRRAGWPARGSPDEVLVRVRAFSALTASLALVAFAWLAWREVGPAGAAVAAALAAVNPVLVQDAHFGRPDSMMLLLAVLFLGLCASPARLSPGRAAAMGALLGVLVACKTTMGLLVLLPFVTLALRGALRREAAGALALFLGAAAVAFLAGEPDAWLRCSSFIAGLRELGVQYSRPFPAQGPIDGGTTFAMAGRYFYATLGASTALLAAAGALAWARRAAWALLAAWLLPVAVFAVLFGSHTNFFERSYGTFLPGVFLAAGAGAAAVARLRSPGPALAAALSVLAVLPGARVTFVLVAVALSGRAEAFHQAYAHRLRAAAAPVPVVNTWLCSPAQLDACLRLAAQVKGPLILAVGDFGDDWTARSLRQLKAALPVRQIAFIEGPFSDLPMSSLQCYNGPSFRYLWIGSEPPPALPVP